MALRWASWHGRRMAGNVVNLNRFRKKKAREEKERQADINRRLHGRTQVEKENQLAEKERATRSLEGKRLVGDEDTPERTADVIVLIPRPRNDGHDAED